MIKMFYFLKQFGKLYLTKSNFLTYYPVDTTAAGNERRPLIHHLYTAVLKGDIKNVYEQDNSWRQEIC